MSMLDQPTSGTVYRIVSAACGRVYIGSTSRTLKQRWTEHLHYLRHAKHPSSYLQRVYAKYGEANLSVEVVEIVVGAPLRDREQEAIDACTATLMNTAPFAAAVEAAHAAARGRKAPAEERARRATSAQRVFAEGRSGLTWDDAFREAHRIAMGQRQMPRAKLAGCFAAHRKAGRTIREIAEIFRVNRRTVGRHLPKDLRETRAPRKPETTRKIEAAKRRNREGRT